VADWSKALSSPPTFNVHVSACRPGDLLVFDIGVGGQVNIEYVDFPENIQTEAFLDQAIEITTMLAVSAWGVR